MRILILWFASELAKMVLCDIFDAYVCKQGYGDEVCRRWQGQTTLK